LALFLIVSEIWLYIENCGQTAADGDIVTTDNIESCHSPIRRYHRRPFTTYRLATSKVQPQYIRYRQTNRRTTTVPLARPLPAQSVGGKIVVSTYGSNKSKLIAKLDTFIRCG